jgi:hypothetical protein
MLQREFVIETFDSAKLTCGGVWLIRDSSAVRRLLWTCCSRGTSESSTYGKQLICLSNSWSTHFHVSWLSGFIFYQKPLYKSLHQSFFYSFITILPSESGVTLHYSTILSLAFTMSSTLATIFP